MQDNRIIIFDLLRTIGILIVLGHHFELDNPLFENGRMWIDVFFCQSGFLISRQIFRNNGIKNLSQLFRFWTRRFLRIWPAYYAVLCLTFLFGGIDWSLKNLIVYGLFVQNYFDPWTSGFVQSWSICVEEHFYLGLPLLLISGSVLKNQKFRTILFLTLVGSVLIGSPILRALVWDGVDHREWSAKFAWHVEIGFLTHLRLDAIVLGILLAWLDVKGRLKKISSQGSGLFMLGLVLTIVCHFIMSRNYDDVFISVGFSINAFTACLLTLASLDRKFWLNSLCHQKIINLVIGYFASRLYSLYLIHGLAILAMTNYAEVNKFEQLTGAQMFYCWLLSFVFAELLFRIVEKPFLNLRATWLDRRSDHVVGVTG